MAGQWKSSLLLVLTAMIWGAAFVAQSAGMEYVGPFTFQACRCALGVLTLLPFSLAARRRGIAPAGSRRDLWLGGLLCGLCLFAGTMLQQFGLLYTSAGKSGFLTALYVVLVPVCSRFLGRRVRGLVWIAVALAAAALYLLSLDGSMVLGRGELLTILCALAFTGHILVIDHYSQRVDGVTLSLIQFAVCAVLSFLGMAGTESPSWAAIGRCWLPIVYAGVLSSGVGYTLQILAQKRANPTVASLLLSLESVFAVLFGALLLGERLAPREYLGCGLMLAAIVLAQLPQRPRAPAGKP